MHYFKGHAYFVLFQTENRHWEDLSMLHGISCIK